MKAVLVIDMPTHCGECPVKCRMRGINHVPTWCPLKPLNKIVKAGDRNLIIYERQWLYNHLEEEFELQKKARDFDAKSHISD